MQPFHSILFNEETPLDQIEALAQPGCFMDLNLDQLLCATASSVCAISSDRRLIG
ncbi:MAG: hypothetical protein ACYCSI_12555 [Solirubrobacteraceae bacterium]